MKSVYTGSGRLTTALSHREKTRAKRASKLEITGSPLFYNKTLFSKLQQATVKTKIETLIEE